MSANKNNIKTITAESLKEKIASQKDLVVVNVLDKAYYDDCKILGSINASYKDLQKIAEKWDKNKKYVVYCASYTCSASAQAYKILTEIGFKNITAYEGGMKEWKEKGFSSSGECKMDYLKK